MTKHTGVEGLNAYYLFIQLIMTHTEIKIYELIYGTVFCILQTLDLWR